MPARDSLAVPYALLSKRAPSVMSDVLESDGAGAVGFLLDRSVPEGLNYRDSSVGVDHKLEYSTDGTTWQQLFAGSFSPGGAIVSAGASVLQWDVVLGTVPAGARWFRMLFTATGLVGNEPVGVQGALAADPDYPAAETDFFDPWTLI